MPNSPCRRAYDDHRLRDLVCEERDPALFAQLWIPRSTAASWIRRGSSNVVTTMLFAEDEHVLRLQVLKLERRVQVLLGIVQLLFVLVRLFGLRLDSHRVPSGETKSAILAAIERAKGSIPVSIALRVLGLSVSRYHTWRRLERACSLEDWSSCPRTVPNELTCREIPTIQQMATGMEYWHMPIRALVLHAQRIGKVFAAPATWGRLIRERGWRRPRQRVYPAKPNDGIRATRPGELLHIDVTVDQADRRYSGVPARRHRQFQHSSVAGHSGGWEAQLRAMISFEFSKEEGTTTGSSTSLFGLMTHRQRRTYDHPVKLQVIASGNPGLFPDLKIPHSTAMSWIRRGVGDVVAIEDESEDEEKLRVEVLRLEHRISMLTVVLRQVLALLRVSSFKLDLARVADAQAKRRLLSAIERARRVMPLTAALRVLGLSNSMIESLCDLELFTDIGTPRSRDKNDSSGMIIERSCTSIAPVVLGTAHADGLSRCTWHSGWHSGTQRSGKRSGGKRGSVMLIRHVLCGALRRRVEIESQWHTSWHARCTWVLA